MDAPPTHHNDDIANQSIVQQVQENFLDDDEGEFEFLSSMQNKKEPRSSTHILRNEFGKANLDDDFDFNKRKFANSEIESAKKNLEEVKKDSKEKAAISDDFN